LESIQNADIVTVVHIVMEGQMFAKRQFQKEMTFVAVDMNIEIAVIGSTAVIVHESAAAKCKQG
jgi:hypothetical protein